MTDCLAVAAGGAIGAVCRFLIGKLPIGSTDGFPIKTFIVNIVGCFMIGLAAALTLKQFSDSPRLVLFLKVGICGGFTTFSSFALETGELMEKGSYITASAYVILSVAVGIAALFAAQFLAEKIF
ncbi:MAG: fluoride efflux transporter CrcB [Ruminococcus sp.]|uniref:fluoride efflux transporter CrcB n=1 Tax=Ruminococcus sp. TaxID=41978 RepID=UPI0025E6EEF4|nr:fluoride efflux transporter CrcB [Ruminococcus sp.]MCR5600384.1 fluoride efflux transporter CrcB [Ruminococcus sp.]